MRENDGLYVVERTMVCIKKTAMRHKRGVRNRSDRNFRATRTGRKNKAQRERAQGHSLYYREERRVASEERDVGFY